MAGLSDLQSVHGQAFIGSPARQFTFMSGVAISCPVVTGGHFLAGIRAGTGGRPAAHRGPMMSRTLSSGRASTRLGDWVETLNPSTVSAMNREL